jgi:hypothetical protein
VSRRQGLVLDRQDLAGEERGLGGEVCEGPVAEVFEDGVLALRPGFVQGAGAVLAAGALLHDAVGDLERPLDGLHSVAQADVFGRSGEAGASPLPSVVSIRPARASFAITRASNRRGTTASAEILSAVTSSSRSASLARYTSARNAYRPSLESSSFIGLILRFPFPKRYTAGPPRTA